MNNKLASVAILLILSIGALGSNIIVHGDPSSIYLSPAATTGPPPAIGQTFTLTLKVTGQTDLWSWKIGLTWNPTVVDLQSGAEGPFLKSDGAATIAPGFGGLNHAAGTLNEVSSTRLVASGLSGGGDLQTFTFKVVGYSATASPINIVGAELHTSASGNPLVPNTAVMGASFTLPGGGDSGATHSFIVVTCVTGVTPLQGVSVSLTGPESQTLTSNSTGKVRFDVTHTGSYSVSGSKSGYQTASGSTSVASAGETKSLSLSLVAGGGSTGGMIASAGHNQIINEDIDFVLDASNSTGPVKNYYWNVTDRTTKILIGQKAIYNFDIPGNYTVNLKITDGEGNEATDCVNIFVKDTTPPVPIVFLTGVNTQNETSLGKVVNFDAAKSYDPEGGKIKDYKWDFGDSTPGAVGNSVKHTYIKGGTYNTLLIISDTRGGNISVKTIKITVTMTLFEEILALPQYILLLIAAMTILIAGSLILWLRKDNKK